MSEVQILSPPPHLACACRPLIIDLSDCRGRINPPLITFSTLLARPGACFVNEAISSGSLSAFSRRTNSSSFMISPSESPRETRDLCLPPLRLSIVAIHSLALEYLYEHLAHWPLVQPNEPFFHLFEGDRTVNLWPSSNSIQPTDDLFPYGLSLPGAVITNRDTADAVAAKQESGRIEFGHRPSASPNHAHSAAIAE